MSGRRQAGVRSSNVRHLSEGQLVTGVVTEHARFGFFVDVGTEEPGVVLLPRICDGPPDSDPEMPEVGAEVRMVFLGYGGSRRQPRLSTRPSDVAAAREA